MTDRAIAPEHRAKLRLAPFAPIIPDAAVAGPNAPIILDTDTETPGKVIAEVAVALQSAGPNGGEVVDALVERLTALGLGDSEALEVALAAIDRIRHGRLT